MDIDGDVEENTKRVQVRFVTKLKPPFKVPSNSIAIPSNLTRLGLSTVVNNLLQAGNDDWKTEPFDFLIDGELVRMSLEDFLLAKGISAEKILEIEYIKAVVPRKEEDPSFHDDWVSAVDGSNSEKYTLDLLTWKGMLGCKLIGTPLDMHVKFRPKERTPMDKERFILTGCYDGKGRIWRSAGSCTHILDGHSDAVTSVTVVKQKNYEKATDLVVATASKDKTIRLWKFDADFLVDSMKIRAYRTLCGHSASVQSIAAEQSGDMICSGSWDCRINLWKTGSSDGYDSVSTKKRKKDNEEEESHSEGEAISTLVGHTQCVSSVVWPQHETIYSASWDHSIRSWDVETGKDSQNMLCGKVINCIDIGGESTALVAAGASDPILRIWDPRKPGTTAPVFQFSSHTSWISACKWHRDSWFHLLSSSYDGKVMLWDLRTAWPLAIIDSHEDKVLCADWWKGNSVVSGGADCKLRISSEVHVT